MSESNQMNYLCSLVFKGIFLPIVLPYFLYKIYRRRIYQKLISSHKLQNKVVLITGASSGLGEALAKVLYKSGCRLILSSRRIDELERVKNLLINESSETSIVCYEPKVVRLDLSRINQMPEYAKEVLKFYGKIDIIINNGGISYRGSVAQTNVTVDQEVMLVNYFGQLALTKAFLPSMIERNSGQIVVISSVQGKLAIPFRSAYTASKHALQAFYDTLRAELVKTNISVCVISPGYIKTNLSINALTGVGSKYGVMDETTSSGMEPKVVADSIKLAIIRNDKELLLSPVLPKIAIIIRALFPNLYFFLMSNRAKRLYKLQENNL